MTKYAYDFLEIPEGTKKPRQDGMTFVRDPGMGVTEMRMFLESSAAFLDYVKFRNVTPRLLPEELIKQKIALCHEFDVKVMSGGMFFQFSWLQRKLDEYFDYIAEVGYSAAEVSFGLTDIPRDDVLNSIHRLKDLGITPMFEWGRKYPTYEFDIDEAWDELKDVIDAGVGLVVFEQGELELAIDRGEKQKGTAKEPLVELAKRVGQERVVFEVNKNPHISWTLQTFGPRANLGPNLAPEQVLWIEPMRRGLGREVRYTALEKWTEPNNDPNARLRRKANL